MAEAYETDTPKEAPKDADQELIDKCVKELSECIERESEERADQLEDLRFVTLDQWPAAIRQQRETDPNGARPCLTIDKISQYRTQIINDIRKNKPAGKVRPVDDAADPDTAEIFQGVARHIDNISSADVCYETAAESAIDIGVGYWRYTTEYLDEKAFGQEIKVKLIPDPFSVYMGPHVWPDGSDAEYGYVIEDMTEERFKREYPKAKTTGADLADQTSPFWIGEDSVRVAEKFYFEYTTKTLVQLVDNSVMFKDEYEESPEPRPPIAQDEDGEDVTRETQIRKVKWCKLTATEVLERRDWAGKYIPIVKVVGHQKFIEGKKLTWGIVRPAIDSARMYNYWASTITERLALSPKMPYVGAKGQFAGMEEKWRTANSVNHAFLEYEPIDVNGNALPAPRRTEPAQVEQAMVQQLRTIEHDIQTSLGMFKASVGETQGDQSGRAIKALQSQSDTATFHFPDNLARSIRHGLRIEIDLIPKIYDTARIMRIMGEDGSQKSVQIDPAQPQAMRKVTDLQGKIKRIYNLNVGTYDVTATTGPSYATKRMEMVDVLQESIKGNPNLTPIIGDLMFRAMDAPMSAQIADRLKKMLPPQLHDEEEGKPQIPPQVQQAMQQMQQKLQEVTAENQKLQTGEQSKMAKVQADAQADQQKLAMETQKAAAELDAKKRVADQEFALKQEEALRDYQLKKAIAERELEIKRLIAAADCEIAESKQNHAMKLQTEKLAFDREQPEAPTQEKHTTSALQKIGEVLSQNLEVQQQRLEHDNKPKTVSLAGLQRGAGGQISGANVTVG